MPTGRAVNGGVQLVTIVGARPQFIKAAVLSREIARRREAGERIEERLLHTGQHFDDSMSDIFFRELEIPQPAHHLGIHGGTHGRMTGRMIEAIEDALLAQRPDWVVVYGDTNSTLAGAIAAAKLRIPLAHVEAGLRSFNRAMPEELNRVLADHAADLLFAPTRAAVKNLRNEGVPPERVALVGDIMFEAMLFYRAKAEAVSSIVRDLGLEPKGYVLATVHRAENTDDAKGLRGIVAGLAAIAQSMPVVLPLHPRTRSALERFGLFESASAALRLIGPVGYYDMVQLESAARAIATDSGGVQKEAFFHAVPCLTLREETEWVELIDAGANVLAGSDPDRIRAAFNEMRERTISRSDLYGDGETAAKILGRLQSHGCVASALH
jgi:UDP-GlcNAc3NAcA epimerase